MMQLALIIVLISFEVGCLLYVLWLMHRYQQIMRRTDSIMERIGCSDRTKNE